MRGFVLTLFACLLLGAATVLAQTQKADNFYEYVDDKGNTAVTNDLKLIPNDRKHSVRAIKPPQERVPPPTPVAPLAPATGPCEDAQSEAKTDSVVRVVRENRFYVVIGVALLVLFFTMPGLKWGRIVGCLVGLIGMSVLVGQGLRTSSSDCKKTESIVETVRGKHDKLLDERAKRVDSLDPG